MGDVLFDDTAIVRRQVAGQYIQTDKSKVEADIAKEKTCYDKTST